MTKLQRQIKEARKLALELLKGDEQALSGACLYNALAVHLVTGAPILAGSYSWRITNVDTGTNPTHFSCIFDQAAAMYAHDLIQRGSWNEMPILPEMHVWNVIDGRVLDISTKFIEQFALRAAGFKFDSDCRPPDFHFGGHVDQLNGNFLYKPEFLATHLAKKGAAFLVKDLGG